MSLEAAGYLTPQPAPVAPRPKPLGVRSGRIGSDFLLHGLARVAAVTVILMLVSLVLVLVFAAMPSIKQFGFGFLVTSDWRPNELQVPKHDANGDPVLDADGDTVMETIPPAFGALPVIYGTAVSSVIALVIAIPLSFGASLFLVRIAPKLLIGPVSFLVEFLAAIPSIAYGIWGLFVLGPFLQQHTEPAVKALCDHLPNANWVSLGFGTIVVLIGLALMISMSRRPSRGSVPAAIGLALSPLLLMVVGLCLCGAIGRAMPGWNQSLNSVLGQPPTLGWLFSEQVHVGSSTLTRQLPLTGRDMLCGSMVLAVMILPIITAISRDVLRTVPRAQIEATVALGATWWQSSWEMLRYCRSGLFGAVMLGLARAAGETMAITMVIGNNNQVRASIFAPAQTMSSLLANEFAEASTDLHRAALTEVALVLLLMSLLFNVVARYLVVGRGGAAARAH